jgi:hypothetical protein
MAKARNGGLLSRLLDPVSSALNEEAARKLIGLRADKKTQAHIEKLARKCNEGRLTPQERAEYENFVIVADFIAILQARAKLVWGP